MYIQIIYLNLSYSFRQLFYAPISLGRKFYFNASESQITHTMWAHLKHTHTHLLRQTHTLPGYLTLTHTFNSWSRASAQWACPFLFCLDAHSCPHSAPNYQPSPPHSLVITHIFSGLKLNHSHCPLPISHFIRFRSNFWARSAKNNC